MCMCVGGREGGRGREEKGVGGKSSGAYVKEKKDKRIVMNVVAVIYVHTCTCQSFFPQRFSQSTWWMELPGQLSTTPLTEVPLDQSIWFSQRIG